MRGPTAKARIVVCAHSCGYTGGVFNPSPLRGLNPLGLRPLPLSLRAEGEKKTPICYAHRGGYGCVDVLKKWAIVVHELADVLKNGRLLCMRVVCVRVVVYLCDKYAVWR